jgi:hypothetical protein
MNSKVATITKYDSIAIFSLGIVANGAGRIFRRHGIIRFGYILGLYGGKMRAVYVWYSGAYQVKVLFLQAIHDDLKRLVRDCI